MLLNETSFTNLGIPGENIGTSCFFAELLLIISILENKFNL